MPTNSKEYMREWRKKHPNYMKEKSKEYYANLSPEEKKNQTELSHAAEVKYQKYSEKRAVNKYKRWSDEDIEKLKIMAEDGVSIPDMANNLNRTVYSIRGMLSRLSISLRNDIKP